MAPARMKVCAEPGCAELSPASYCKAHAPAPWQGSTRAAVVGKSGWDQAKDAKRILRRHAAICHVCGQPGATQVDHVIPLAEWPDGDVDSNKRPIHESCHKRKTQAESMRGKQRGQGGVPNSNLPKDREVLAGRGHRTRLGV
jgi:5-methylcytosine-specific restriction endonuclease McrA